MINKTSVSILTRPQGSPSVATHNPWDIPLANFTVFPGDNHIHRPDGGSKAEAGALKHGEVTHTNVTLNTETNKWEVIGFDTMFLDFKIIPDLTDILKGVIDEEVLKQLDEAGILGPVEDVLADLIGQIAPGVRGGSEDEGGEDVLGGIEDILGDFLDEISEGDGGFEEIKEAFENLLPSDSEFEQ